MPPCDPIPQWQLLAMEGIHMANDGRPLDQIIGEQWPPPVGTNIHSGITDLDWYVQRHGDWPSYAELKESNNKLNRRLNVLEAPNNKELSQAQRLLNEAQNKAESFQKSRDFWANNSHNETRRYWELNIKYNKLWWRAYYHRALHLVLLFYGIFATTMWLIK